jgi:hypothetical protein
MDLKGCRVGRGKKMETVEAYLNHQDTCHYTVQEKKGKKGFNKSKLKDKRANVKQKDKLPGKCKHYKEAEVALYNLRQIANQYSYIEITLKAIVDSCYTAQEIYRGVYGETFGKKRKNAPNDPRVISNNLRKIYMRCSPLIERKKSGRGSYYQIKPGFKNISYDDLKNLYYKNVSLAWLVKKYKWEPFIGEPQQERLVEKDRTHKAWQQDFKKLEAKTVASLMLNMTLGDYLIQVIKKYIEETEGTDEGDLFMRCIADLIIEDFKNHYKGGD